MVIDVLGRAFRREIVWFVTFGKYVELFEYISSDS